MSWYAGAWEPCPHRSWSSEPPWTGSEAEVLSPAPVTTPRLQSLQASVWTLFMGLVIEVWSLWTLQSFSGLPAFQFPSLIVVMSKAASGEAGGAREPWLTLGV